MKVLLFLAVLFALFYLSVDWREQRLRSDLAFWRNQRFGAWTQQQADEAQRYIDVLERKLGE